jgi:integrase
MKLDAKTVAALDLGDRDDLIFWDEDLRGFGFRLRRSHDGKRVLKSWICQYKRAGRTSRVLIGPDVLTAKQAREKAGEVLARVHLGEDPAADRRERRDKDKLSLRSQVEEYLAIKAREVRPKTHRDVTRYLTSHYFKPLHAMALDKISRKDVGSRLVAIGRDSNTVAAKARDTLSAFFTWAMQNGLADANPCIGTRKPPSNPPRERVLSDAELVAVWNACQDDDYGKIVRLIICLGARRQEIGGMRFSEIDLDKGLWTLPAARSKNKRAHTLPLHGMALDIIRSVPRLASRDQLFGTRAGGGFMSWDRGKAALDQRCGISNNWGAHDLRRTAATRMADIGVQPHLIEQILNHVGGHKAGPAGIYNRSSYEREVRNALGMWEDHLRALIAGGGRKVIPMQPPTAS